MSLSKLFNRARMSVGSAPNTGSATLGSAISGYLSFASSGVADGDVVTYLIEDGANFEIGQGTYTASGTSLARTTVYITSAGNTTKINATANAVISLCEAKEDLTPATAAEYLTAVAKYVSAANAWAAIAEYNAGNTGATTVTLDMSNSPNQLLTATGNFTLAPFTNVKVGMTGTIRIQQDGTGSRTWTLNSAFKIAGGTAAALSTTVSAYDDMDYKVEAVSGTTATRVRYTLSKDVK